MNVYLECQAKQIQAEKGWSKSHRPDMGTHCKQIDIPVTPRMHFTFISLIHWDLAKASLTVQRLLRSPPSSRKG